MPSIITALDDSEEAVAALRLAHRLAAPTHQQVLAVEATPNPSMEHDPAVEADYLASRRAALLARIGPELGAATELVTVDQEPFEALVTAAAQRPCAAVVIGSAPVEGIGVHGFGSLAHALAHHLTCPLIVVPAGAEPAADEVVVGVDGSAGSERALRVAGDIAAGLGDSLCAVYAVDDIYTTFSSHGYYGAEEQLARAEVDRAQTPVCFVERFGRHPSDVLADVAVERRPALLVVAAREHHSLGGRLLGDVADRLLHAPPCPVMVLPHHFAPAA